MHQFRGVNIRAALIWTGVGLALFVALGATAFLSGTNTIFAAIAGSTAVLLAWLVVPARPDATPKWMILFMLALVFSTVLPAVASTAVQLLALVGAFFLWLRAPESERRGKAVVTWAALIVGLWVVLMIHPNIPSLNVGALGLRKTVLCVAGVVAGAAISRRFVPAVERSAVKILLFAVAVSIALHIFLPGVETSIGRGAAEYTATLAGESRLQGVFAGPFHAALAGLLLIGWGLARLTAQRALALASIAVGAVGMYMSLVRTAYVAAALVVIVVILLAPTFGKVAKRFAGTLLVGALAISVIAAVNPAVLNVLDSIGDFSTDARFQGRFPGYAQGIELFTRSPIFGWGSGSAGDTMQGYFLFGNHITSHNVLLKIAVEGGLIGVFLWFGLFISIARRLDRRNQITMVAGASLAALLGMGFTVASTETLPISYFLFFFVGLALTQDRVKPKEKKIAAVPRAREFQRPLERQ